MKKYIAATIIAIASLAIVATSFAGTESKSFKEFAVTPDSKFKDQEIQLDLFYTQVFGPSTSGYTTNTGPGGGFGINAIFARYFGVGINNFWYSNNNVGNYFLSGNAILRYPIEALSLAPYATVGGGAGFGNTNTGFGSVGGGVEYRVTNNVGTFVDAKWLFGAPNYATTLQTGLRLNW